MSRLGRVRSEAGASYRSFLRRRTAVFFTFFFPLLIIAIFAGLIRTGSGGGLFARPPGYYVPGYLAVVVLFTPLSRLSSTVARHREGSRFEKLATTPLSRAEWLAAHTLVNVALISAACVALLAVLAAIGASFTPSPWLIALVPLGSIVFCGVGAVLGSLADSQDGAISASNGIALPLLFLSDTFVAPDQLPAWFAPVMDLSPLTYFSRGVRAATYTGATLSPAEATSILLVLAAVAFALGAYALPWRN